jgi:hypothetical protein
MNYTIDYYFDLQSIDNENVIDILKNMIDSNNISDEPLDYQLEILDNKNQTIIFKGGEPTATIPYRYFEEVADYLTHRKREVEEERNSFLDSLFKPTKPKEEEVVESAPVDISETTNEVDLSPSPLDVQSQESSPVMDVQIQESPPVMDVQIQESPPVMDVQIQESPPVMDTQLQESPPIMDTQIQESPPVMDTQVQQPPPVMDTQVQQPPVMDAQIQESPPIMDTQIQESPIMDTQPQQQPLVMDTQVQQQPLVMDTQTQQQPTVINNQIYQGGKVNSSIITVRIIIQKMNSLPFLFLKKMRYHP